MSPFSPKNSLVQKNTKPKGSLFQILGPVTLLKRTAYVTKAKEY